MKFEDRYAMAVRTSNLKSESTTTFSSADILGAAGLAAQRHPLAISLLRLFTGDNAAAGVIVDHMTQMTMSKAHFAYSQAIDREAASIVSRLVLDWYRDRRCRPCRGLGHQLIPGTPKLSDQACKVCGGAGLRDFDAMFPPDRLQLAKWLASELEREMGMAGPAAMAALKPKLDL